MNRRLLLARSAGALTFAALALVGTPSWALDHALVGRWAVIEGSEGSLPGMMVFKGDNKVEVDPYGTGNGFPGTWSAKGLQLQMDVQNLGKAEGKWKITGTGKARRLRIDYANGTYQTYIPFELPKEVADALARAAQAPVGRAASAPVVSTPASQPATASAKTPVPSLKTPRSDH